jgi:GH25 family lysozyme M1 (1,4-beta-N-acetylmuramidase)
MIQGCDISAMQGNILPAHAKAMKAAGIEFVFHRCKVGNNPGRDKVFEANVRVLRDAGILVGAYSFPFPLRHLDPIAQADAFAQAAMIDGHPLGSDPGELPPPFDLEWPPPEEWTKRGIDKSFIVDWSLACLARMRTNWRRDPLAYSYPFFLTALSTAASYSSLCGYALWIAGGPGYVTGVKPPVDGDKPPRVEGWGDDWTFWQWNGTGGARLPHGVDADFNVFRGDLAALHALCAPPPPPVSLPPLTPEERIAMGLGASTLLIDDAVHAARQERARRALVDVDPDLVFPRGG